MKINNLAYITFIALAEAANKRYIIAFKKDNSLSFQNNVQSIANIVANKTSVNVQKYLYDKVVFGMSSILDDSELAKVNALSNVDFVEEDGVYEGTAVQNGATWGLARISHKNKLDASTKNEYSYDSNAGSGVTVYVVDSGININHVDFGGRATWGANFIQGSPDKDEHGHGTHCAGTVGSNTYGVAKKANLVAVKVLDKNKHGSWSDIIAGLNWVVKNAKGDKNVISFSIGGKPFKCMDKAVNDAYDAGIFVVVAAMNDNVDACGVSPARAEKAFTVGATNITDTKADFSNWGSCVKILGPGVNVLSTGIASSTATEIMSGTSMATPHIAGIAATLLSENTNFSGLKEKLISIGTNGAISGFSSDTPNILANNGLQSN